MSRWISEYTDEYSLRNRRRSNVIDAPAPCSKSYDKQPIGGINQLKRYNDLVNKRAYPYVQTGAYNTLSSNIALKYRPIDFEQFKPDIDKFENSVSYKNVWKTYPSGEFSQNSNNPVDTSKPHLCCVHDFN
ncbi:hypothetical protein A3Q56_04124 [Intoshia linei]|uniref:Uncharacterized protein n=1 Tax=Intoshia linei TaxID=1819745 RepID=A0A177B1X1_9BILA|nr:hypothetical protein A3Q56_04124 [Intoshia linei]